jgi:TPR repeat protein
MNMKIFRCGAFIFLFLFTSQFAHALSYDQDLIPALQQKKHKEGVQIAMALAEKKDTRAQIVLSTMYKKGYGGIVPIAPQKALYWLNRAVKAGDADAMSQLGDAYQHGDGVQMSKTKAMELYHQSASLGTFWGMHNLGNAYREGAMVPKNTSTARFWYTRALASTTESHLKELVQISLQTLAIEEREKKSNYNPAPPAPPTFTTCMDMGGGMVSCSHY